MISSRFEELQNRCQKIRKRKIFIVVLIIIFLSIAFAGYYLFIISKHSFSHKKISIKKEHPVKIINKKIFKKSISPKSSTLKLQPIIKIPKIEEKTIKTDVHKPKTMVTSKIKTDQPIIKKNNIKKPKNSVLQITTTTADAKTVLLKNYSIKKDYTSALKLAKYFLKKGDFNKALYWAKNANKLNSTKESSWIIYAKAKYALGKKEDAIESLKTFLNIFYSKKADKLLQKYMKAKK